VRPADKSGADHPGNRHRHACAGHLFLSLPQAHDVEKVQETDLNVNLSARSVLLLAEHVLRPVREVGEFVAEMENAQRLYGIDTNARLLSRVVFAHLD
jgi:hypothetical protein